MTAGREMLFFVGSRGHHADIGGRTPGSSPPDSRHIEEEGVLIDNWLLVRQGAGFARTRPAHCSAPVPAPAAGWIRTWPTSPPRSPPMRPACGNCGAWSTISAWTRPGLYAPCPGQCRRVGAAGPRVLQDGSFTYPMDDGGRICVRITRGPTNGARPPSISPAPRRRTRATTMRRTAVCQAAVLYVFRTLIDDRHPAERRLPRSRSI